MLRRRPPAPEGRLLRRERQRHPEQNRGKLPFSSARPGWGRSTGTSASAASRSTPSNRRISMSAVRAVSSIADRRFALAGGIPGRGHPGGFGLQGDHGDVVGNDVVKLAGDPRPFPASGMLEQLAGGGLTSGMVDQRRATRSLCDPRERRGRRQRRQQHRQHRGFGSSGDRTREREDEEDSGKTDRDPLRPGFWFALPGEAVQADQLRDQRGDGQPGPNPISRTRSSGCTSSSDTAHTLRRRFDERWAMNQPAIRPGMPLGRPN